MQPAISIQNVSKKFNLAPTRSYVALRDVLTHAAKNIFRLQKQKAETFWALQDINLEIAEGERIGIIGHNGAGKSTLLKIISRITPPTTGKIILNGRVASLLEVGTGFHPELTGRENIYLNGSILGLKKKEIDCRLEEIIDFSGVEQFIDAPLKQFSSGMQLRLAFAVAAHLEAEILLIDEVLAVGDLEFQKKCIGKMEEISRSSGRTIVFVSHNMAAVKQLCTKAFGLSQGKQIQFDDVEVVVNTYANQLIYYTKCTGIAEFDLRQHPNKKNYNEGLLSAKMYVDGKATTNFIPGADLTIKVTYYLDSPLIDPEVGIVIKDEDQVSFIGLNNKHIGKKILLSLNQEGQVTINIPNLNIYKPGKYRVNLYFGDYFHFYELLFDAFEFSIAETDVFHSEKLLDPIWNRIYVSDIDISVEK